MSLEKLYDSIIRKHNSHPYHCEKKDNCVHPVQAHNFICGDRFDLCIYMENEVIESVYFHGLGCAVSKASASVLARSLEGATKIRAREICDQFLRLLNNRIGPGEKLFSEEFKSFQAVREIQARYDCAALAWEEVGKFLQR